MTLQWSSIDQEDDADAADDEDEDDGIRGRKGVKIWVRSRPSWPKHVASHLISDLNWLQHNHQLDSF